MRIHIVLVLSLLGTVAYAQEGPSHAKWDGERFSCPGGTDIWADENEAIAGKDDYAYCIGAVRPQDTLTIERLTPKPNSPFGAAHVTLYDDAGHPSAWVLPVPHRTADRAFWVATGASFASVVVDVENTHYTFASCRGCREANPIFFSRRPSRTRLYEIALPLTVLSTYLSYRQKRREDAEVAFGMKIPGPRWWVYHAVTVGSHTFGTLFTIADTGR
jgi:hypothetical protein